jgi:hypothetical protein
MSKFIRHDENSIDKLFRQKLQDAEEPTPLYLWEGVRQRSAPKRRFLWWWFAGAIVALGLITWAVSGQSGKSTNAIATTQETKKSGFVDPNNYAANTQQQTNSTESIASVETQQTIVPSDSKPVAKTSEQSKSKSQQIKNSGEFREKKAKQNPPTLSLTSNNNEDMYSVAAAAGTDKAPEKISAPILATELTEAVDISESTVAESDEVEEFHSNPSGNPVETAQHIKPAEKNNETPVTSPFVFSAGAYCLAGKPQGVSNNKELNQVLSSTQSSFNHDPKNSSLGIGLFGKIETKKHFTLQLGFDAQKVTSKVELTNVEVGEVLVTSITPDSTFIEDFVPTYTFKTTVFQSNYMLYNTYLLVGKDFYWRKIYFGIQTGPVLRFNNVTQALPETYNDSTYVIYPQGKRIDIQASAQFGVLLNDHLNLFVHFQERWMLPVWKSNDSRMVHPAIGLGVSYKFH